MSYCAGYKGDAKGDQFMYSAFLRSFILHVLYTEKRIHKKIHEKKH